MAVGADVAALAFDEFARIEAAATDAAFSRGASHRFTGIANAETIDALEAFCTFAKAARIAAFALFASHALRTDRAIVGYTVAIVIAAIAHFLLRFGCGTRGPASIDAQFFAATAIVATLARQTVVDQTVAIVVFAIAHLGFWLGA